MVGYIFSRILQVVPLLIALSIVSFLIIELPPGDYLTSLILRLEQSGKQLNDEEVLRLKKQYGLDRPAVVRYSMWIWRILRDGDFGRSFTWQRPVAEVITERIVLTMVISIATLLFTWVVAVPAGIYSAVRQYSPFDYVTTFFGFIGLSIPNFLLALILMWLAFNYLDVAVTGLFSPEYADSAWSLAKVGNMLSHIWIPILVIGTAGTAGIIRVMRGCLLDELRKQYVVNPNREVRQSLNEYLLRQEFAVASVSSQPEMPNRAKQCCQDAPRGDDRVAPRTGAARSAARAAGRGQSKRSSVTMLEEPMILVSLAAACRMER